VLEIQNQADTQFRNAQIIQHLAVLVASDSVNDFCSHHPMICSVSALSSSLASPPRRKSGIGSEVMISQQIALTAKSPG
jgi:hypothetical protein